jgi:hypothetical protein
MSSDKSEPTTLGVSVESTECPICCSSFNKRRTPIECIHVNCRFTACKSCVLNYNLNTPDHLLLCMGCKKDWPLIDVRTALGPTFVKKFKEKAGRVMMEREIARIPECMECVEWEKERLRKLDNLDHYFTEIIEKNETIQELKKGSLDSGVRFIKYSMENLVDKLFKFRDDLKPRHDYGRSEIDRRKRRRANREAGGGGGGEDSDSDDESYRGKFIMPCPRDCNGFLSSAYKCALCDHFACPKCMVDLDDKPASKADHECDPDTVKTVAAIKKQTRPCPTCGERISKASGCDQMWCTQCHIAFSWRTGQVAKGAIHNPHYIQYMHKMGKDTTITEEQLIGCAAAFDIHAIVRRISNNFRSRHYRAVSSYLYRLQYVYADLVHEHIPSLEGQIERLLNTESLRIKYVMSPREDQENAKKELAKSLIANQMRADRLQETLMVYALFRDIVQDTLRNAAGMRDYAECYTELQKINSAADYCNEQLARYARIRKIKGTRIKYEPLLG